MLRNDVRREPVYKLEYLPYFDLDLAEAEDYLYEHSPAAADKLVAAIYQRLPALLEHPLIYPVYEHDDSLRFMVLPYRYLCFYYVDEDTKTVRMYRLLRGMRDIPNIL
jgi:plasmid stabilization system protein ParE